MNVQHQERRWKIYERARLSRDARFDGRFFIGVKTTKIYCRSICPVKLPKPANVTFFATAAAAAEKGYRPCLRCRPEASPGTPAWAGTSATVSRAMRLISEGALDADDVDTLATRLGIGSRHLSRLFEKYLGASPIVVAQTRRLHFAKRLIDDTNLKMSDIAMTAGYRSIRRFNAHFKSVYSEPPSRLRRKRRTQIDVDQGFVFMLRYRPPYDWDHILNFLSLRAVPGVESVIDNCYIRNFEIGEESGILRIKNQPDENSLQCHIDIANPARLLNVVEKIKQIFDLNADPEEIKQSLVSAGGGKTIITTLLRHFPGTRVPGCWDGFEIAVRAIVGQQISVPGATTIMGRIVQRYGKPLNNVAAKNLGIGQSFPTPDSLANLDVTTLSMPQQRAQAIKDISQAVVLNEINFFDDSAKLVEKIKSIKGIGEWTAQYVAMRACSNPDAFLSGDIVLQKAAERLFDKKLTHKELLTEVEQWRPWRAYIAILLWRSASQHIKKKTGK